MINLRISYDLESTVARALEHVQRSVEEGRERHILIGLGVHYGALKTRERQQHDYQSTGVKERAQEAMFIAQTLQHMRSQLTGTPLKDLVEEFLSQIPNTRTPHELPWQRLEVILSNIHPSKDAYQKIGKAVERKFFHDGKHDRGYQPFVQRYANLLLNLL